MLIHNNLEFYVVERIGKRHFVQDSVTAVELMAVS